MNARIDLQVLAQRESEQVEWKRNVADIDDVLRTITAFSNDFQNMGGGYVVCGAEEVKDEYGFQKVGLTGLTSDRLKELEGKVLADCRAKITPPVTPVIEELAGETPDRRVLVFIVRATGHAHAFRASADKGEIYYIRRGRQTVEARNGLLRELLVLRGPLPSWDRRLNERATLKDIDLLSFRETLEELGRWEPETDLETYFSSNWRASALGHPFGEKNEFDNTSRLYNFALLLFGKNPTHFFPGAWTKISVYPGVDRSEATSARHELTGTIISQVRKALDILQSQSWILFDKQSADPNVQRYPDHAVREALVNALAHRDYESNEPTSVTIFSDRIEFRSPGALPRALDKDTFLAGKAASAWRNQALAYFFNKLQLAQAEGQGIPTIYRSMRQIGSPAPRFELQEAAVTCILPVHPRHDLERRVSEVKQLIVDQDLESASAALVQLLTELEPSKGVDLLGWYSGSERNPERMWRFLKATRLKPEPEKLTGIIVFQIANVLRGSSDEEQRKLGDEWLKRSVPFSSAIDEK